jgi:hypothetical protein
MKIPFDSLTASLKSRELEPFAAFALEAKPSHSLLRKQCDGGNGKGAQISAAAAAAGFSWQVLAAAQKSCRSRGTPQPVKQKRARA